MKSVNCLIVDDEPIASDIIINYCSHLPYLNVVASCRNALQAKKALLEQKVDIIFLDINMPVLSGVSFLKTLKDPPLVIFTTAYKEYAVEAFDLAACDYLVKPFSLERFIIAVDKMILHLNISKNSSQPNKGTPSENYSFIKAEGKIYKVYYDDLLYAEAKGNYSKIMTGSMVLSTKMPFNYFESLLPKNLFVRIHRSFIINKSKITHIEGNTIYINEIEMPIGANYKEAFFNAIGFEK